MSESSVKVKGSRREIEAARMAVQRLAPEEMPLFEATVRAWRRRRRWPGDDLLGFGPGEVEPVITTAALAAAYAAGGFLARTVVDAAREETKTAVSERVRRVVRRLFGRRQLPSEPAPELRASVTPAELTRIRDLTQKRLYAIGLPAEQAALVADAVVGALVTSGGASAEPDDPDRTRPRPERTG
jgi:hypothetical protein